PVLACLLATGCSRNDAPAPAPSARADLPPELEQFRPALEASKLDYVRIKVNRHQGTKPWASKFRGIPYRLKADAGPGGRDDVPLYLLAQINFADMPPLAGYPRSGILQFFIGAEGGGDHSHLWGMRLDDEKPFVPERYFQSLQDQAYFRVIYHASV